MMQLNRIVDILNAKVLAGREYLSREVEHAFSSDLMSDVLTIPGKDVILLTGLSNIHSLRAAEMADINQVAIVRNKPVSQEMIDLAEQNNIVLLSVDSSLFRASGMLFSEGIKPLF
jgi:predicted transcriptional regulator